MGRLLAPRGDSSSGGNSSSKGGSSGSASKGGATKRDNGKEWIQSSSGMWVEKNSDAGKRVQQQTGGSSSGSRPSSTSGSGYGNATTSSNRGWNPGDIVTEGGRDYIRSSTGMKVPLDSDAGRRVQSQYANRGGSGGGYNQTTKVLSDYIGPNGGFGGYGQ